MASQELLMAMLPCVGWEDIGLGGQLPISLRTGLVVGGGGRPPGPSLPRSSAVKEDLLHHGRGWVQLQQGTW